MRRFFPKRRTADLIPQMKALGIDRVIDKVSDSLSALEQAKEEAWEARASRWNVSPLPTSAAFYDVAFAAPRTYHN